MSELVPVSAQGRKPPAAAAASVVAYVTLTLDNQLCGLPVLAVRDVLAGQTIARMPLAPREVAGNLNLRGRIVTAIDLRQRLRLAARQDGAPAFSVVTEHGAELYALMVDQVHEVVSLPAAELEPNPPTLPPVWAAHSRGIHRVGGRLMVVLDVDMLFRLDLEGGGMTTDTLAGADTADGMDGGAGAGIGPTCLVVDDSRVVRRVARRILEGCGLRVEEAEHGGIALEMCRARLPDSVLLDWNMPVMNGIEFLRALRAEFGPDRPVVVFCTTENDMGFIEAAIEAGAQEYMMKPFDETILRGKLEQVGLL